MIVIHLLTGLVFGLTSVLFSVYADHGFLVGLMLYSASGICGMCLSVALSMIPIGAIAELGAATFGSKPRGKAFAAQSCDRSGPLDNVGLRQ